MEKKNLLDYINLRRIRLFSVNKDHSLGKVLLNESLLVKNAHLKTNKIVF